MHTFFCTHTLARARPKRSHRKPFIRPGPSKSFSEAFSKACSNRSRWPGAPWRPFPSTSCWPSPSSTTHAPDADANADADADADAAEQQLTEAQQHERTCCAAAECFGLSYLMDVFCAIPTQARIALGHNRLALSLFPFYEACWPCMACLFCAGGEPDALLRRVSRAFGFRGFDEG